MYLIGSVCLALMKLWVQFPTLHKPGDSLLCSGGKGRKIRNPISSLVTQPGQGQPGLCEILFENEETDFRNACHIRHKHCPVFTTGPGRWLGEKKALAAQTS